MSKSRVWFFRILVLAGIALLVVSWLLPLWRSNIQEAGMFVTIRPWGLEHNLGNYVEYMGGDPGMPAIFAPLMWAYLVAMVVLLLIAAFVKEKTITIYPFDFSLPRLLLALCGVAHVIFVVVFVLVASVRTAAFGVTLTGVTYVAIPEFHLGAEAISGFLPGFWLACLVGPFLILLALLRNVIMGKAKA